MAAISIMITDNRNGVINNSFNFAEEDIARIERALSGIYKPQLEQMPTLGPFGEHVSKPYNPSSKEIYYQLSKSLVAYIINSCHEEELNKAIFRHKESAVPIALKENY